MCFSAPSRIGPGTQYGRLGLVSRLEALPTARLSWHQVLSQPGMNAFSPVGAHWLVLLADG